MTLEDLRRLAVQVEPLADELADCGLDTQVVTFNGAVSRFREVVVRARNAIVQGQLVHPALSFEVRTLTEALREERRRLLAGAERFTG